MSAPAFASPSEPDGKASETASRVEATQHFRRGVELVGAADFGAALVEFRRAYQLAPQYRILYNIGQVSRELQDSAGALQAFQRYLEDGADIAPARRREVESIVETLDKRVGRLTVACPTEGAEISVDDVPVGKTPFSSPVVLNAGRRKVAASRAGSYPQVRFVDVAGGDALSLTFDPLIPIPQGGMEAGLGKGAVEGSATGSVNPTPAPSGSPIFRAEVVPVAKAEATGVEAPSPRRAVRPVPWLGWVAAGVLGAGAATLGALTLSASHELADLRAAFPGDRAAIDKARRRTQTFAIVSDVLTAGALLTGGVSLYLTVDGGAARRDAVQGASLGVSGVF
jgi:hypothetical protein